MKHRFVSLRGTVVAVIAVLALSVSASGQGGSPASKTAKKWTTAWGDPDLQGVYDMNFLTPIERPKELAGREFLTEEEVAAIEGRQSGGNDPEESGAPLRELAPGDTGTYNRFWNAPDDNKGPKVVPSRRTSLIIDPPDGRLPPMTPEAQKIAATMDAILERDGRIPINRVGPSRLARLGSGYADSYLDRDSGERCLSLSLPRLEGNGVNGIQIAQGPGFVVIYYERRNDTRVIPVNRRPHLPEHIRQWLGDPVAHWEGQTLVVDTTNFTEEQGYRDPSTPESGFPQGKLHLVERFTRIDDKTLDYQVTIEDPATWTRPFTVAFPWTQDDDYVLYEYACHEGNDSLTAILAGRRAEEKAAAEKAGPAPTSR
jgi:hypothetical protein